MADIGQLRIWLRLFTRGLLAVGLLLTTLPASLVRAEDIPGPQTGPNAARVIDMITWLSGETPFQTTRIYDRRGELLADIDDLGRRTIVGLDEIPEFLIQATIATEDRRFYTHDGIDYVAIIRAAWQNSQSETIVSGGSTITQQLARLLFMPPTERYEQSLSRKMKEARLAMDLEKYYTKDEIIAMYLNMVYYGHQAYGIAAAAEIYFSKTPAELTASECALLAGLPQSPLLYDPLQHPRRARQRQHQVLTLMVEAGFIDADQARKIGSQPILFHPYRRPGPIAPHFVNYVRDILVERYGTKGLHLGYQVHTSLDARYQRMAERIARAQVRALGKKHHFSNAAVVILQPQNGEILAMVGSIDFNNKKIAGQVNMAIEPRQPGSSIKPVLYAAAFDRGWSPASVIWDTPVSYQLIGNRRYRPTNITKRYYGPLRLRMALSNSLNVPAVKLLDQVGIPAMLETAKKLGIESWRNPPSEYGLSLAVGGYEVSLLELTHAFATIANKGVYTRLRPIRMVEDGAGRVVYRAEPASKTQRAISAVAAYQLASVLSDARARKTMFGRPSALDTSQITAVKTGTTDGWRDNLTVGFTSYLSVGVWTGNSNGKPMQNAIGLYTAAPIWHDIMEAVWADPALVNTLGYLSTTLPKGFTRPAGTKLVPVCDWTPGRFTPSCPRMLEEVFPIETARKPPAGRTRGYCLPAGAKDAPIEAYFMPLPKGTNQAVVAQRWMQQRYRYPSRKMTACNTTPKKRRLVKQPRLLPPRQLVKLPVIKNASAATINAFKKSGD